MSSAIPTQKSITLQHWNVMQTPAQTSPSPGQLPQTGLLGQAVPGPSSPLMRLARVRVRDFRSIEDAELDLGDITVLMGENNVGKSALLDALNVAIGERPAITTDLRIDTQSVRASRFIVDLEMLPWSGPTFDQSVTDLLGMVLRANPATGQMRYFLRVIGVPDDTQRAMRIRRGFLNSWDDAPAASFLAELDAVQRRALWFSLLDAQRDLVEELRMRGSPWGKLLRRLQLDDSARGALEDQLSELSSQVTKALPDSKKLSDAMSRLQSVLAGQVARARLTLLPKTLHELWRTTDLLVQASGHPELSISQQGMGARSLSSILAFRAWLEAELAVSSEPPLLVVTAFEEPESHLHPQAQRAVFAELKAVAGQRIFTTHSPYLASVAALDDFRVIRRNPRVVVKSARGISSDPLMTPDGLAKVRRFCLSRNGDMIYARLVILGEGDTEAGVLPEVARAWWNGTPEERGVAIIPMDGVGNTRTFASFLERLGIPWIALLDGDKGGLIEYALMQKVPALASIAPTRVIVVKDSAGLSVDIEHLLASEGRQAAIRALAVTGGSSVSPGITTSDLADKLRSQKATMSKILGEELAKDWLTHANFPKSLSDLFTLADTLLS